MTCIGPHEAAVEWGTNIAESAEHITTHHVNRVSLFADIEAQRKLPVVILFAELTVRIHSVVRTDDGIGREGLAVAGVSQPDDNRMRKLAALLLPCSELREIKHRRKLDVVREIGAPPFVVPWNELHGK